MTHRQRYLRRHRRTPFERMILLVFGGGGLLVLAGIISLAVYVVAVAASTPDINRITPLQAGRDSIVYASDGSVLGVIHPDAIRDPIPWSQMPVEVRRATVAIEDKRFFEHGGVDYQGILRAALTDLASGAGSQGGSTITQQLVRDVYLHSTERDISRKIREVKLATQLEERHSKTWILWQYLNNAPYGTFEGRTALGIEAAAQLFFNEHANQLTLGQAALLAGLPQAPSAYNPYQDPAAAIQRRDEVLTAMENQGYISGAQAAAARSEPLVLHQPQLSTPQQKRDPYFFDYVEQQLIQRYGLAAFRLGGFKVYTTVDPNLQRAGRAAIATELTSPSDPGSAIVSIDPQTGYIRAMASSYSAGDHSFNLAAQGRRQPGSAFKVFVLTTAILDGVDPDTTIYDSKPVSFQIPRFGTWRVHTYDNTYVGPISITNATLRSDNTVYAQLDMDLGPHQIAAVAHRLGITSHLDGVPSEGLGGLAVGVSPLEMASAYATIASGGIRSTPKAITRVVLPSGNVDNLGQPQRTRVISKGVAYEVTKVLEENMDQGTGTEAAFGCPAAGKTGTTDHYNDAWFVGYTPTLASSVWVGYPNALISMTNVHGGAVTGSTIPARIWRDFMQGSHDSCQNFSVPTSLPQLSPYHGAHALTGSPQAALAAASPAGPTTPTSSSTSPAAAAQAPTSVTPTSSGAAPTAAPTPAPAPAAAPTPSVPASPAPGSQTPSDTAGRGGTAAPSSRGP